MSQDQPALAPNTEPRQPFGLPLGTIRGFLSVLICGFFWMVMLWPQREGMSPIKIMLGHFFLLALVSMAFVSHPGGSSKMPVLPWLMRFLFVGGSIIVGALAWIRNGSLLKERLTPEVSEFTEWWMPYLLATAIGFGFGILFRFILGRENQIFRTVRSWLSIVGMLLLLAEYGLFIGYISAENKPIELLRYWQAAELVVVAAYFGTRT
jgi:hypothetical protein